MFNVLQTTKLRPVFSPAIVGNHNLSLTDACLRRTFYPLSVYTGDSRSRLRVQLFYPDDPRVTLYFTMGRPFPPSKLPLYMGDLDPPSNTWFRGPTRVLNPNGISIGSAVFAGLTSVTGRQTDRPRYTRSVTVDRIYVRSTSDEV